MIDNVIYIAGVSSLVLTFIFMFAYFANLTIALIFTARRYAEFVSRLRRLEDDEYIKAKLIGLIEGME